MEAEVLVMAAPLMAEEQEEATAPQAVPVPALAPPLALVEVRAVEGIAKEVVLAVV